MVVSLADDSGIFGEVSVSLLGVSSGGLGVVSGFLARF